jgi:hypothetical protein
LLHFTDLVDFQVFAAFIYAQNHQVGIAKFVDLPASQAAITKLTLGRRVLAIERFHKCQREGFSADTSRTGYQVGMTRIPGLGMFLKIINSGFVTKDIPHSWILARKIENPHSWEACREIDVFLMSGDLVAFLYKTYFFHINDL